MALSDWWKSHYHNFSSQRKILSCATEPIFKSKAMNFMILMKEKLFVSRMSIWMNSISRNLWAKIFFSVICQSCSKAVTFFCRKQIFARSLNKSFISRAENPSGSSPIVDSRHQQAILHRLQNFWPFPDVKVSALTLKLKATTSGSTWRLKPKLKAETSPVPEPPNTQNV